MVRVAANFIAAISIWIASAVVLGIAGILLWVVVPRTPSIVAEASTFGRYILGEDPSRWEHFVYAYQTLIGGMLAILAALLTVFAMIIVDRKQARRHDQLVQLNLRQDKMRLERLLVPQLAQLRARFNTLTALQRTESLEVPALGQPFGPLFEQLANLERVYRVIRECISCPAWEAAEDMFDGRLTNDCIILRSGLDEHFHHLKSIHGMMRLIRDIESSGVTIEVPGEKVARKPPTDGQRADLAEALKTMSESLVEFTKVLDLVTYQLRKLAGEYRIELTEPHWITPLPDRS